MRVCVRVRVRVRVRVCVCVCVFVWGGGGYLCTTQMVTYISIGSHTFIMAMTEG